MIDCHNHMLPEIDDGAHDWEMAVAMANRAVDSGIDVVVCTPHHNNGVFENSREKILLQLDAMRQLLQQEGINLQLVPGSELHLVPELLAELKAGQALTYADRGKAVLVELPKRTIPADAESILDSLIQVGLTPVVAHPERNGTLAEDPDMAIQWTTWGCKLQLTAMSCSGRFGAPLQEVSRYLVESGAAHLIASDAHRPRGRAPDMRAGREAIESWVGTEAAHTMTVVNPANLVDGLPLQQVPIELQTVKQKKSASRQKKKPKSKQPSLMRRLFGG